MLSDDAFLNDKNVLPWARGARTPLYTLVVFLWGGGPTFSYLDHHLGECCRFCGLCGVWTD